MAPWGLAGSRTRRIRDSHLRGHGALGAGGLRVVLGAVDSLEYLGKVWKWHHGDWQEAGLGGYVTPIFAATVPWERADCESFWGPSIHWNTWLKSGNGTMGIGRKPDSADT